jgi:hypothetical protein
MKASLILPAMALGLSMTVSATAQTSQAPVFPSKIDPQFDKLKPAQARIKTCAAQFKANKAANANGGLNWIQKGGGYWSQCNKKLKG